MLALRKLSAIYLMAASVYSVTIVLSEHPPLARAASNSAHFVGRQTAAAAIAVNTHLIQPTWKFAADTVDEAINGKQQPVQVVKNRPAPIRVAKHNKPASVQVAKKPASMQQMASQQAKPAPKTPVVEKQIAEKPVPAPVVIANEAPPLRPRVEDTKPAIVADNAPVQKKLKLVPQAPKLETVPSVKAPVVSAAPTLSPMEITRVTQRLHDNLTPEMLEHFDLFLYVSKAANGSWAQHMFVYQKLGSDNLKLLYNWPVSTGREKIEYNTSGARLPSFTPNGYYQLDPDRFHAHYRSVQWNQPMPFAMFFNWVNNGYQTGLAIHGASGEDVSLLGTRASAGCVRLSPENAKTLFNMIRSQYAGLVPKFAYDKKTATMANDGMLLHDRDGRLELTKGYKVLVFIENYGGSEVVAALF